MKKVFIFPLFLMHILCAYSQAFEIPTKFSKMFKSATTMTIAEYESKKNNLQSGEILSVFIDSAFLCVVSRTGDTWSEVSKLLHDPDNYNFTKTFMRKDTLEQIKFFPTGKIIHFAQNECGELCPIQYQQQFNLKEYIIKNLSGFRW